MYEEKNKYPHKLAFFLGAIILIFAILGVVLVAYNSISYIVKTVDSGSDYAVYNEYLTPVAAVDIDTFDDIAAADTEQLLNASIWLILSAESTPDTYSYSGGYMLIPSADVESAYMSLFGPETVGNIVHTSVQSYNCTFEYDSTAAVYKIPVTAISPVYTPSVTEVKESGSSLILTVNYLASESWDKDSEGNFVAPEPDKVMRITLKELQGSYYISSVQTVSNTVPETVVVEQSTSSQAEINTELENTTASSAEKTTLGGKVY
ncbi:MAG: hypothetical protein IJZ35_02550 [Clostridia bacterium]|nr:hypothetical protein [Clostridia bacterium]